MSKYYWGFCPPTLIYTSNQRNVNILIQSTQMQTTYEDRLYDA